MLLILAALSAQAGVVINEIYPNAPGSDSGYEWFELYNSGPDSVDLTAWTFERAIGSYSERYVFEEVIIESGQFLVVGEAEVVGADLTLADGGTLAMGNASSSCDAVRIVDGAGAVVDTLIYGPDNSDGFEEDDGFVPALGALSPSEGLSVGRVLDGGDSDDSVADFAEQVPTLGASNEPEVPEPIECDDAPGSGVVLEELYPNPEGDDAGFEWVEVANRGALPVDVSGWSLWGGTSEYAEQAVIPEGTLLAPGAYYVIAQSESVVVWDLIATAMSLGNASSSSDAVQLRDCDGGVADTVIYGRPNSDEWLDDAGLIATVTAPTPDSGEPLTRFPSEPDTDDSDNDFDEGRMPSPGAPYTMLHLDSPWIEPGEMHRLKIRNAPPGATVGWVRSFVEGRGSCPAAIAPACFGVEAPVLLGLDRANDLGVGVFDLSVPPGAGPLELFLQAVAVSPSGGETTQVNWSIVD